MRSVLSSSDVLIAGGGPAGATLAIFLGRAGLGVELFEQARFPREKPCGEGLMPAGVAVLERLALAEAVGGEPFLGIRYHVAGRTAEGRFPARNGQPVTGRAQRRLHLDHVLLNAAASTPNVAVHAETRVEAPVVENGRVAGLRVDGAMRRARLVVAADGAHSRIRNSLGLSLPPRRKRFGARMHFRLAPGRQQPPWVDVFACPGYELYVAGLPGRELLVAALADSEALAGPIEQTFLLWCHAQPVLAERLDGAQQVSDLLCTAPLAPRARCGVAPGLVLLGDAAGSMDPITGGGMTHALLTAELLAEFVSRELSPCSGRLHAGHSGSWPWRFERQRAQLLRDYRMLTHMVLWLARHPRSARHVVAGLRAVPGVLSYLVGVAGGAVPT